MASHACRCQRRQPGKRKFKAFPINYFRIDIAEVQTAVSTFPVLLE
jgi:hypothetical protein